MKKTIYLPGLAALSIGLFLIFSSSESRQLEAPERDVLEEKLAPSDFLYITRNYPDGAPDRKAVQQSYRMARRKLVTRADLPGFGATWTLQGPGNLGGRINTVTTHPRNPQIRLVGTTNGGIWKSTNGGQSWRAVFDDQPNLAIADIVYDPVRPDTLFAATGDPNIPGYVYLGEGVYRSADGGDTWQYLGLKEEGVIAKVWVSPANPNILLAGAMGIPMERSRDRGMYRSTDGGQTWTQVLFISQQAGIIDLVQNPRNPDELLAASWDRIRTARESTVEGPGAMIWKSTDAGATWTQLTNGLPSGPAGRIGLTASRQNPNTFFALYVGMNRQLQGIYKTTNSGASWTTVRTDSVDRNALGGFGWYFGKIGVNPADDGELYVLGVDLHATQNNGQDWDLATPPWFFYEVHADKHDIHFISPDNILLATDGGLYETFDRGRTWIDNENLPITQFYRIAHNPHVPGNYYGGAQDNGSSGGNLQSINFWERIFGGDGFQMRFDPNNPDTWWCMTQNGRIFYTTDGGFLYDEQDQGFENGERPNWDAPFLLSKHDPSVLYTGRQRVYRASGGAGSQWDSISSILPVQDTNFLGSTRTISALEESPLTPNILYAGTGDGRFWASTDYGATWNERSGILPERYITSIVGSPTDSATVFVTHSGLRFNDFFPHIHRSDDNGQTWTPVAGDLPPVPVNKLLVVEGTGDSLLVAGTNLGVYASADGGLRWELLGDLPLIPVFDLGLNPARDELVAGTYGRSIQTYPLDSLRKAHRVITSREPALPVKTVRAYPNPASGFVQLDLPALQLANARADLFSLAGKKVRTWTPKRNAKFDLQGLPAGMYLLKLVSGKEQYSSRIVIR